MKTLKFIYFVLIFGAIFMDCPTGLYFGLIGRCWLGLFVPICFLTMIIIYKHIRINQYIQKLFLLVIWIIIVSIFTNIIQFVELGNMEYLGENLWIKSLKTITYWIEYIMYLSCILECVNHMSRKEIILPFLVSYFSLFVILILELIQMPYAFENFHFNAFLGKYERVRLTTTESSMTVPLIICYGLFSAYYAFYLSKSRILKIMVLGTLFIFAFCSGSKTLLFMYIIATLGFIWINRKRIKKNMTLIYIGIIGIAIGVIPSVGSVLWNRMMEMGGSTATRGIQLVAAIIHSIKFPFGNGGASYMYQFRNIMFQVYEWVKETAIGEKLSYWEILNQIYSDTDEILGVVAGFWQLTLNVGIVGGGFWLYSTWKYLKKLYNNYNKGMWIFKIMIICFVFMWFFTTTMLNVYFMWAAIIIVGLDQFTTTESELKKNRLK